MNDELLVKPDADVETDELDLAAVARAYKIIKLYNDLPDVTPELRMRYEMWLTGSHKIREKDEAMKKVFDEIMEGAFFSSTEESGETEETLFSTVGEKLV